MVAKAKAKLKTSATKKRKQKKTAAPKFDFDRKFQIKLIRIMFQYPDEARDVLDHLEPQMFDTAPMRWVLRKLKWCLETTGAPATDTVLEHEAVRDVRLGIIKDSYIDAYAQFIDRIGRKVPDRTYILDRAHDYVRYVAMREFLITSANNVNSGKGAVNWPAWENALDSQRQFGDRLDGGLGQDFFADTSKRIKRRKSFEASGIPTGIMVLDDNLRHNGLPPRQLGVVVAPAGRGKTGVLVYIGGSAILNGYKVLHITLELDEDVIAERYDARFSGIKLTRLDNKPKTLRRRLKKVVRNCPGAALRVKYWPEETLTVTGLRSYLRRLEAIAFYPDLMIIDYVDNMNFDNFRGQGGSDNDYTPLGRLYKAIRGLGGELNLPIWTASHSNRTSVEKKELDINDLADSFKKAAVADVMVAIAQSKKEIARKIARLCTIKNRNGRAGLVDTVRFDMSRIHIADI